MKSERCTFVIPTFNGAAQLGVTLHHLFHHFPPQNGFYEYVIVDDGSSHDEWAAVKSQTNGLIGVRVLRVRENIGQHRATLAGILESEAGGVVTLDDDSSPELINTIRDVLAMIPDGDRDGCLLFVRTRYPGKGMLGGAMRAMVKLAIAVFSSTPSYLAASSTRILDASVVHAVKATCQSPSGVFVVPARRLSLDALLFKVSSRVRFSATCVQVAREKSRYTPATLTKHAGVVLVSLWKFKGYPSLFAPMLLAVSCSYYSLEGALVLGLLFFGSFAVFSWIVRDKWLAVRDLLAGPSSSNPVGERTHAV